MSVREDLIQKQSIIFLITIFVSLKPSPNQQTLFPVFTEIKNGTLLFD